MSKTVLTILVLSSILCVLSAQESFFRSYNAPALTNLAAVSGGQILLTKGSGEAYIAQVDFAEKQTEETKMSLALYTSLTVFTRNCLQFTEYKCSQYNCKEIKDDDLTFYYFPYFFAEANNVTTKAWLDYSHWALNENAYSIYTVSCQSQANTPQGEGTYGLVGLGLEFGGNGSYFTNVTSFTLSAGDKTDFKLEFSQDISFKKTTVIKYETDKNWHIPTIARLSVGNQVFSLTNTKAILDINHPSIGFPLNIYNEIIQAFGKFGIQCSTAVLYQAECTCDITFDNLPKFNISVKAEGDNLQFGPEVYIVNGDDLKGKQVTKFNLNIRGLSRDKQGDSFVTKEYQNSIILGSNLIRRYITHFDTTGPSISLFTRIDEEKNDSNILKWVFISLGIVLAVALIAACVFFGGWKFVKEKISGKPEDEPRYVAANEEAEEEDHHDHHRQHVNPSGEGTSLQPQH